MGVCVTIGVWETVDVCELHDTREALVSVVELVGTAVARRRLLGEWIIMALCDVLPVFVCWHFSILPSDSMFDIKPCEHVDHTVKRSDEQKL